MKFVLVVEDSDAALRKISENLEALGTEFKMMAQVDSLDGYGIAGYVPGADEEPFFVAWNDVKALFCDYEILGQYCGADVVEAAARCGVWPIIGMSSSSGYNRRLLLAGAGIAEPKPKVISGLGLGRWKF